jgi:predicted SnoaL-like aldol condensation-catalyzing enzyme
MSNISSSTISKTTEQENEVLARRFHMEIFQKAKFSVADEILTPDFVLHNPVLPVELTKGPEGVKRFASDVVDSCPGHNLLITKRYPKETRY